MCAFLVDVLGCAGTTVRPVVVAMVEDPASGISVYGFMVDGRESLFV